MSYHRLSTEGDVDAADPPVTNSTAANASPDDAFPANNSIAGAVAIDIENGFDSDYAFSSHRKKGLYTQLDTDDSSPYNSDTAAALAAKQSSLFTDNSEEEHKSAGAVSPSDPDDPARTAPSPHLSSTSSSSGLASDEGTGMDLIICRVGHPNHTVSANSDWTIKQLKTAAFPEESAANKNIRFIFQGKLLADDKPLHFYNIQSQSYIHCAITDPRPVEPEPSPSPEEQEAEGDYRVPTWILAQHQMAVQTREGGSPDFILGFVMGFVLGVLALLWMWQRVPRKQKLGITCGLVCNLFFSFVRFNVNSDSANDSSGSAARGDGGPGTGSG